jgi:hypothetical protein
MSPRTALLLLVEIRSRVRYYVEGTILPLLEYWIKVDKSKFICNCSTLYSSNALSFEWSVPWVICTLNSTQQQEYQDQWLGRIKK